MKTAVKVTGEVELSEDEVIPGFLKLAKQEKSILLRAVNLVLAEHNYQSNKIATSLVGGKMVIRAQVTSVTQDQLKRVLFKPELPETRNMPSGFVRKNVGFYKELVAYLESEKKQGRKEIPFNRALEDMAVLFETLDRRRFDIYIRDKRQQKTKGFVYDTKRKVLIVR